MPLISTLFSSISYQSIRLAPMLNEDGIKMQRQITASVDYP